MEDVSKVPCIAISPDKSEQSDWRACQSQCGVNITTFIKSILERRISMDTSMGTPSGGFIDGLKALITPDVLTKASSVYGESEAAVTKGLGAVLPTVLGGLASKATD